jgi:hypothetical protein
MPNKLSEVEFIERCKIKHNNKYDYSQVQYVNTTTKIKIICPLHVIFNQVAKHHLRGDGCPACKLETIANKKRTPFCDLINQFNEIHNAKYDYTLVNYTNTDTPVNIICPEHGIFSVTPYMHKKGQGCRDCKTFVHGSGGYTLGYFTTHPERMTVDASLYVAQFSNPETDERFYKIGITSRTANVRLRIKKQYNKQIIEEYKMNLFAAFRIEQTILKTMKHYQYIPKYKIGGWTECLLFNDVVMNQIRTTIVNNKDIQNGFA